MKLPDPMDQELGDKNSLVVEFKSKTSKIAHMLSMMDVGDDKVIQVIEVTESVSQQDIGATHQATCRS